MTTLQPHPMDDNYRYLNLSVFQADPTIFVVSLDRPRKHNAINARMWKEVGLLFNQIAVSSPYSPCRCVLLRGNGKSFCAGIDVTDPSFMSSFHEDNGDDVARKGLAFDQKLKDMQQAFTSIEECPVPVVACIHGNCLGAGIDMVTACQVRLCSHSTRFSVKEVALGLAADVGTLQRLPKVMGNQSLVHELCYTGRPFTAEEALQMGLVSRVVADAALFQDTLSLCQKIAQHSPLAVQGTKQALLFSRDHSVRDSLDQIAAYNRMALQADDVKTAFLAATKKEKPSFPDMLPRARL